ncbi:hypothetical protein PIB30_023484 [Stylosanthes scabra]|uniref:Uncharacterized protein n=1 Tax=Stylosanthes scabra TaxID=79078 RepID=A0ABU6S9A5_9FABA|nr:hypothetical protein [Stylosanthes scabra]
MGEEAPPLQWRPELYNLPLPDPEDDLPPSPPSSSSSSSSSSESDSEVEPEPEPFLIKTFFKHQRHHSQAEYAQALNGKLPKHHTLIHTWTLDISLREISNTVCTSNSISSSVFDSSLPIFNLIPSF